MRGHFSVRSLRQLSLWSVVVLHSAVLAFRTCGEGRSERTPPHGRVSIAFSTRIRNAGMEWPAIATAATERWSVRGPGDETPPRGADASNLRQAG